MIFSKSVKRNESRKSRWKKSVVYILLTVIAITSLTGCGSKNGELSESDAPNQVSSSYGQANDYSNAKVMAYNAKSEATHDTVMMNESMNAAPMQDAGARANTRDTYSQENSRNASQMNKGLSFDANEPGMERKLIYHANLSMKVEDYGKAQSQIRNLVHLAGAYVLQFSDNKTEYEKSGVFTIKVPSGGFQSFISQIENMKPIDFQQNIQGNDVTEEYVDLGSRLKAKQMVESRLLSFMEKATKADDLVSFSNELGRVQEEIEQMKGRMNYLDQNVAYSTVELRFYQEIKKEPKKKEKSTIEQAWDALAGSTKGIVHFFEGLFVVLAGLLPVLILLGAIGVPLLIKWRKNRKNRVKQNLQHSAASSNQPTSSNILYEETDAKDEG